MHVKIHPLSSLHESAWDPLCGSIIISTFASRIIQKMSRTRYVKKFTCSKTHQLCRSFRCPSTYKQNRMRMVEGVRVPVARLAIERPIGKREFEKTRKDAETNDETRIDEFSRCRYSTASTTFLGET